MIYRWINILVLQWFFLRLVKLSDKTVLTPGVVPMSGYGGRSIKFLEEQWHPATASIVSVAGVIAFVIAIIWPIAFLPVVAIKCLVGSALGFWLSERVEWR